MTKISDEATLPLKYVGGYLLVSANDLPILNLNPRFMLLAIDCDSACKDIVRRINLHDELVANLSAAYDHLVKYYGPPELTQTLTKRIQATLIKAQEDEA